MSETFSMAKSNVMKIFSESVSTVQPSRENYLGAYAAVIN